jgi:choline dehydrogenase
VLLLEAGGEGVGDTYSVPAYHALASEDPAMSWNYFVRHYHEDDRQRRDDKFVSAQDGVLYPRSATLGGCTAHNALITVYPHNHDWDEIAQVTGDETWTSARMRAYFERLERCTYEDRPWALARIKLLSDLLRHVPWLADHVANLGRHGFNGWLTTSLAPTSLALHDSQILEVVFGAAKAALENHLGRPLAALERLETYPDPNDWRVQLDGTEGLWMVPMATRSGRRNGTRERIDEVRRRHPKQLAVRTHALVSRILFGDRNRAVGVEFLDCAHAYRADPSAVAEVTGQAQQVFAGREVILSAGAFNTPQLLMLSGIGPKDDLQRLGIEVRVDLPGVGKNLQDRYEIGVISRMKQTFSLTRDCLFEASPGDGSDPCYQEWLAGKGVYTSNGVVVAITKRSFKDRPDPDLFMFGLPAYFKGYYPGYSLALERHRDLFTWAILKAHTRNTAGTVSLRSTDPCDTPRIDFHYFDESNDTQGEDLASLVNAVGFVRGVLKCMDEAVDAELLPGPGVSSESEIAQFIKDNAWGHHASCTCKIASADDPDGVLDSRFRVRGVSSLRVVDASVFPRIPGFFIVSAVYMISEKASAAMLAEAS